MSDSQLVDLRIKLYRAAQTLSGSDLADFWALLDEVQLLQDLPAKEQ